LATLQQIANSRTLLLSSLTKVLAGGEYTTFANEHALIGYTAPRATKPLYQELVEDLFFCSFTLPGPNAPRMWNVFADDSRGVRMRFRVTPLRADLRKVGYSEGRKTTFGEINTTLRQQGLIYTPWGISRICAFYLGREYKHEDEYRLLVKRFAVDRSRANGDHRVWPVQIVGAGDQSDDSFCKLELVSVTRAPRAKTDVLRRLLDDAGFVSIPVLNP
jgi:hypothetical protein